MNQFWILDYPSVPNSSGPWTTVRKIIRWYLIFFMLGALKPLLIGDVSAAERTKPILIGALTDLGTYARRGRVPRRPQGAGLP